MADIDQIIAGGAGAGTTADFSGIPKLLDYYWKGKDENAKNDLREAFKGGLPMKDGQPDWGAVTQTFFQKGSPEQGIAAANLEQQRQMLEFGKGQSASMSAFERGGPPQQPVVSPSTSRPGSSVAVLPALNKGGEAPQGSQGGATVMKVLAAQGIPNDQLGAASASVARQLGVDPTAPIDTNDPQIRNVLVPAVAQLKRMGVGQVAQAGQPQQQTIPPIAQAPQAAPPPQGQPSPVTNSLTSASAPAVPSRAEQGIALYGSVINNPLSPKNNVEGAKLRLEAFQKSNELTPLQKEYAQGVLQGYKGTMQEFEAERETGKTAATERAKADVKEQQEIISAGRGAQARLGTLNTITNVINSDKNLNLGFGSETTLKVKMALEQAGMDFGDLSGSQLIQKLNGVLASESSKQFSTRPTQFEFKTFLANNPGLALDEKGNVRMLGILSQTAKREADLGKLARQNQDNWQKWDDVVENYDKANPIKDPTTGKVLSNHSIIAPVGKPKGAASPAGTQTFSSPSDVHAAVAAGKLKSGDAFLTSDGKTKYVP